MYRYFDYCYNNNIEIFYCKTDSMLIREIDSNKMSKFISKEYGYLKIESRYNNVGVIVSQGKFILRGTDKTKNRNMTTN
jgi:hypothetical protein